MIVLTGFQRHGSLAARVTEAAVMLTSIIVLWVSGARRGGAAFELPDTRRQFRSADQTRQQERHEPAYP